MRGPLPRTDLLLVYRWDDGTGLFLEPSGSWSDKLGKNVLVWYLLLQQREGGPVLARLQPDQESGWFSIVGPSEQVRKELSAHGSYLRGFLLDVGARAVGRSLLFSISRGPVLDLPVFVSDEVWDGRYAAAESYSLESCRAPSRKPFLGVVHGLSLRVVARAVDDPSRSLWLARGGSDDHFICSMKPFREAVDRVVEDSDVRPERERRAWEEQNVRRGAWVVPTADELELFSVLGEPMPLLWNAEKLYAWYLERLP